MWVEEGPSVVGSSRMARTSSSSLVALRTPSIAFVASSACEFVADGMPKIEEQATKERVARAAVATKAVEHEL